MAGLPGPENATKWAIRIVPIFIFGAFGFAAYAVVAHLCVDFLYRRKKQHGTAIALIVLYFVFFLLTLAAYFRTLYNAQRNQGLVPWTPRRADEQERRIRERQTRKKANKGDVEQQQEDQTWLRPDMSPDSPGLEAFYSKDVFVCEADGRPRWCTLCWTWKPDRAHHSTELDRCVRKMDHLCPWVGGMISETSFNFFFQFTNYCFCFCIICLSTAAYCLHLQKQDGLALDGRTLAIIVLGSMFAFFSAGMSMTSGQYIFQNKTSIDMLRKAPMHHLAIRVPRGTPATNRYHTITYPLPYWPPCNCMRDPSGQLVPQSADGVCPAHPGGRFSLQPPQPNIGANGSSRDREAQRTFAVVRTDPGENPWDLGIWRNFTSVMGHGPLEWFLPIRHSPCCSHDSNTSEYEYGPLIKKLRKRYNLPQPREDINGDIEMHHV